jgi:hypothetical protein
MPPGDASGVAASPPGRYAGVTLVGFRCFAVELGRPSPSRGPHGDQSVRCPKIVPLTGNGAEQPIRKLQISKFFDFQIRSFWSRAARISRALAVRVVLLHAQMEQRYRIEWRSKHSRPDYGQVARSRCHNIICALAHRISSHYLAGMIIYFKNNLYLFSAYVA